MLATLHFSSIKGRISRPKIISECAHVQSAVAIVACASPPMPPVQSPTMLKRGLLAFTVCCIALSTGCAAQNAVLSGASVTVSGPAVTVAAVGPSPNPDNTPWRLSCPGDTWMFGLDIAGDPTINSLGPIYCTTAQPGAYVTKTGELAGRLPTPAIQWREYGSATGYSNVSMRYAANGVALIEGISFTYGPGESENPGRSLSPGHPGQAYGGIGDGKTQTVACPAGHIITELFGETNMANIVTIGLKCRESSGAVPTVQPEPQPGSTLADLPVPAPSLVGTTPTGRKLKSV